MIDYKGKDMNATQDQYIKSCEYPKLVVSRYSSAWKFSNLINVARNKEYLQA
jgi:hypothetical protein